MLYSSKCKKNGFQIFGVGRCHFSQYFHFTHTQIGWKLENILNKLLKKRTVHVLHQFDVLRQTTEERNYSVYYTSTISSLITFIN